MQHECRITVLETKVFTDYQEKYLADPKSGPCPCFKEGDTFVLKRTSEQDDFLSFDGWKNSVVKPGMQLVGMFIPLCKEVLSCINGQMTRE